VEKQLSNAYDKLERAQKHAEDKKLASQRTIERLQREYDEMVVERRDNDKQVEELRGEADAVESKVCFATTNVIVLLTYSTRWRST
jgi:kinetochore protein Nuf2